MLKRVGFVILLGFFYLLILLYSQGPLTNLNLLHSHEWNSLKSLQECTNLQVISGNLLIICNSNSNHESNKFHQKGMLYHYY